MELEDRLKLLEENNAKLSRQLSSLEEERVDIEREARSFTEAQIQTFQLSGLVEQLTQALEKESGDGQQLKQLFSSFGIDPSTMCNLPTMAAQTQPQRQPESQTTSPEEAMDFSDDLLLSFMNEQTTSDSSIFSDPLPLSPFASGSAMSVSGSAMSASDVRDSPLSDPFVPTVPSGYFSPFSSPALPPSPPSLAPELPVANKKDLCEPAVLSPLPSDLSYLLLAILSTIQLR